jgi:hypothetical protein
MEGREEFKLEKLLFTHIKINKMDIYEKYNERKEFKQKFDQTRTKEDLITMIAEYGLENYNRIFDSLDHGDYMKVVGKSMWLNGQFSVRRGKEDIKPTNFSS